MLKTRILLAGLALVATLGLPTQADSQSLAPPLPDSPTDAAAASARQAALTAPRSFTAAAMAPAGVRARQMAAAAPRVSATRPRAAVPASSQAVAQHPKLGANFANYYVNGNGPRAYAQMRDAGVRHERITFNMNAIEPSNNVFTWDAYDAVITDALASNIQVLGVLIAPSNFARRTCPESIFGVPTNLDKPWDDPRNEWASWVFQVASRYSGTVQAWEVWNEPNFTSFWCGSALEFAQMTRVSYQAIKAANPAATVVLAPMYRGVEIGRIAAFFEALRDLPDALANGYYHDVIGFHLYDGGHCTQFDEIEFLDVTYFRPNVGAKPIWNTESGIRVRDGGWPEFATSEESAYFAISNLAYSLHKNVGRYYYFRAIDEQAIVTPEDTDKAWGLLQFNGAPRPSYSAMRTMAQFLPHEFEWSVRKFGNAFADDKSDGPVSRITFYNTALGRVSVLYNISNTAQSYTFTGILSNALFIAPDGVTQTATVNGANQHVLQFSAAPNFRWGKPECQVPSKPLIIIEADTTPPTAALKALPLTHTLGLTLTWTSSDTIGGSGVWWHEVQIRPAGGDWQMLNAEVVTASLRFAPATLGQYGFRVRARDRAGNVPDWSATTVISTTILPPDYPNKAYLPLVRK